MKTLLIHLRNKILLCFLFTLTLFSTSCNTSKNLNCDDVQALKFAFLPKGLNSAKAISDCEGILSYIPNVMDTIITDQKTICRFTKLVNDLAESENQVNEDYRIICLIFIKDSKNPKRICFGEGWLINFEGVIMKDDANLFNFLDTLLYNEINVLND